PPAQAGRRPVSQPPPGEVLPVRPLVERGTLEALPGLREDVLFDDEPAAEAHGPQAIEDAADVEIASAERREHLAGPDLRGGRSVRGDPGHERAPRVLEVDLVDP